MSHKTVEPVQYRAKPVPKVADIFPIYCKAAEWNLADLGVQVARLVPPPEPCASCKAAKGTVYCTTHATTDASVHQLLAAEQCAGCIAGRVMASLDNPCAQCVAASPYVTALAEYRAAAALNSNTEIPPLVRSLYTISQSMHGHDVYMTGHGSASARLSALAGMHNMVTTLTEHTLVRAAAGTAHPLAAKLLLANADDAASAGAYEALSLLATAGRPACELVRRL